MPDKSTRDIAEKFARLFESETAGADLSTIQVSIEKINDRLDSIESILQRTDSFHPSSLIPHPSMDRFQVIEAVADEVSAQYQNEKACTFEPNGKPCDHCSMCSSLGF